MGRLAALYLGLVTVLPGAEIRGVVLEAGGNLPVPDARVSLTYGGGVESSTVTDATGAFRFEPAELREYTVEARKDGYVQAGAAAHVSITAAHSKAEVQLTISRPGRISARLVEQDEDKP